MENTEIQKAVESFLDTGSSINELVDILSSCMSDGSDDAMRLVMRLFMSMYGGYTYNLEFKATAAAALLHWGDDGLDALLEGSQRAASYATYSIAMQLLSSIAADDQLPPGVRYSQTNKKFFKDAISKLKDSQINARSKLIQLVLSFEDEDSLSTVLGQAMITLSTGASASARELLVAVSKRWLAVSTPVLEAFDQLIEEAPNEEPKFQQFLTEHPQLLDPIASKVWPLPDLFGYRKPDFIVQRADGSYLVIEIECPGKRIVTSKGQLSAEVTQAEQQANEYRSYIQSRSLNLADKLPGIDELDALVIVGLERNLNTMQARVLKDANRGRNKLRIAGFDWLSERASTVAANVTGREIQICKLRAV